MKRQSFLNRRIPSIAGIAILLIGIVITSTLVNTGVIFTGRAAPGNTPQNVVITNISDTSFSVTYTTSDSVLGSVRYQAGGSDNVAFDIRDQKNGQPRPYKIHVITVNNLTPDTTYSFSITSGGASFTNNGKAYTVKTGKKITAQTPKNTVVKGKVVAQDGSVPKDALVYIHTDSSQILSTISSNGSYTISTNMLRTKNLESYLALLPTTKIKISAVTPDSKADVTVLAKSSNPVAQITLANTYDFASTNNTTKVASQSAEVTGFPMDENAKASTGSIVITAPKEGQALSDQRPTLKGTAPASAEIEIILDSEEPLQANVIADRRGNWTYRPKNPVPPGEVELTVNARDGSGITKSATQSFTILASGSQFTEPSVSPTKIVPSPTKAITPTNTPTPTNSGPTPTQEAATPTPTTIATPTPITSEPTQAATPTVIMLTATPTTLPTLVPSGGMTTQPSVTPAPSIAPAGANDAILYAIIGAVAITIGAVLLFLTGGISF